ncbi:MAG: ABC transporter permease subunit [Pseudonocardiaceae bacterium]|nr:ABC transporter permease subunit [Pseudonocardiaceae bacterium]
MTTGSAEQLDTERVDAGAGDSREPDASRRRQEWWVPVVTYSVTLFALVTLNFLLPRLMPGDPIDSLFASGSPNYVYDEQTRAALAAYYGLDQPLLSQYGTYLQGLLTGDLGYSIAGNEPVGALIAGQLPWTLLLMGTATALSTAVGILAGVHGGWRRGRPVDRNMLVAFIFLLTMPAFLLAVLAVFVFAVTLGWVPLSGAQTPFASFGPVATVADISYHLLMPAIVLAIGLSSYQYLLTRAGVVGELGADYLVLGRAKGLTERRLKYRYGARNALLPVVSQAAMQLGTAVTGAVLVERVFAYPGIGNTMVEAIPSLDYPVVQGCFLMFTVLVLSANLVADLLYRWLDPRTTA